MELSEKEVLRYLGYHDKTPDKRILSLINHIKAELNECVNQKSACEITDCLIDGASVTMGCLKIQSEDLSKHLTGCRKTALFAATLGAGADTLIRRYSAADMEKAVIAQAICTAMIEAYCDEIESKIASMAMAEELFLTARFSPGYGDFNVIYQQDLLHLLDCGKRIGLTLTEGYMLIPVKSVIAVIGLTEHQNCDIEKCNGCDKDCEFRR